jgi:hypothetical protein
MVRRTRDGWVRWYVPRAFGVVVLVTGLGVPTAGPASADPVIRVEVGVDGHLRPDHPLPVAVTVTADRALRGKVVVTPEDSGGGRAFGIEIPVELAAGSTKDHLVVVPGRSLRASRGSQVEMRVRAELFDGDVPVVTSSATADWDEGYELVGVLPTLLPGGRLPDDLPLRFGATGRAKLAAVDVAQLDAGVGGGPLGPFASIVAAPADLAALSPAARDGLLDWLGAGGQLYVDADGGPVPALPEAWQPTGGWASAGDGVVRLSRGHAAAGRWSAFLEPTRGGWAYIDNRGYAGSTGGVSSVLGSDAGILIPPLGALIGLAVVYILLIGPVGFIVLARMRRRTLAWLTVPALSVLFTGIFSVAGMRSRTDTHPSHSTIIEVGPGGARARSAALLGSAAGGTFDLRRPAGWRPAGPDAAMGMIVRGPGGPLPTASLSVEGGATRARAELASSEFRQITATGPLPGYGEPLRVQATSNGQAVTGTVTNESEVDLHQVTVMVHNATTVIGTVPARSARPFTMFGALHSASRGMGGSIMTAPEAAFWPRTGSESPNVYTYGGAVAMPGSMGPCRGGCLPNVPAAPLSPPFPEHADAVNGPLWTEHLATRPLPLRRSGAVSVVGWTRELPSPLTLEGEGPLTHGRTGLVAQASINPDPAAPFDSVGVRLEQVRGTKMNDLDPEVDPVETLVLGPVYRLIVPPGVPPESIVVEPPLGYQRLAISAAGGWKVTPEVIGPLRYRLAPDDVVDGVVYLQVRLPDQLAVGDRTDPYLGWRIRAEVAGEELTTAVPAAQAGGAR